MDRLAEIVKREVFWYAGGGRGIKFLPFANEEKKAYAVNVIDSPVRKRKGAIVVLARVVGDRVVIDEDNTDRPLVDALVAAGIPRDKIALAYAGEPIPEGA